MKYPLTDEQKSRLLVSAKSIYAPMIKGKFDITIGDGWDTAEYTGTDAAVFYVYVRIVISERLWLTRFKFNDFLVDPEIWFRRDAAALSRAI